ncbi:MAG: tRNA (adenosine(37)-N6)-threonylcarbamoyltransferase complex transferase subunit TsaD, partial [Alphaproteobacteria bacterium]
MEGHALTARLTDGIGFPYLALLVSGGHCMLVVIEAVGRYHRLGATIDDAAGEAFDKTAKMLGLGFPGGPAVERMARRGNGARFALPRPLKGRDGCDFSFSGLKTAVRHTIEKLPEGALADDDIADVCASFQFAVGDVMADRCGRAIAAFKQDWPDGTALAVAGGVSANQHLRAVLEPLARDAGLGFVAPPQALCTDNGAMIAWAGLERLRLGLTDGLDFAPRPRWPMDGAR